MHRLLGVPLWMCSPAAHEHSFLAPCCILISLGCHSTGYSLPVRPAIGWTGRLPLLVLFVPPLFSSLLLPVERRTVLFHLPHWFVCGHTWRRLFSHSMYWRRLAQLSVILAAVCMYIMWATCYLHQLYPLIRPIKPAHLA